MSVPWPPFKDPSPNTRSKRCCSQCSCAPSPSASFDQHQPKPTPVEDEFFRKVQTGNPRDVDDYMRQNAELNVNCRNESGLTALHLAIDAGNLCLIETLLKVPNIKVHDALLHAVQESSVDVVRLLVTTNLDLTNPCSDDMSVFPEYVTPMILAAQRGHAEIIKTLLDHGLAIAEPIACHCNDNIDFLYATAAKINTYRALINPTYICLTSRDPVLTAFNLSHNLRTLAAIEPEFRSVYMQMARDSSAFAVRFLSHCRSSVEVEIMLKQPSETKGPEKERLDDGSGDGPLPRLGLAMAWNQMEFVAHPCSQAVVSALWRGGKRQTMRPLVAVLIQTIPRIFILPLLVVVCFFAPGHSLTQRYQVPEAKFVSHFAAYVVFLAMIGYVSNLSKRNQSRGPPASGLELFIILFVVGFVWNSVRLCLIQGRSRFLRSSFNQLHLAMCSLFAVAFLFWFAACFDVMLNDHKYLERKYWHYLDPTLLGEGFFAIAVILAYLKLLYLCPLDYALGPLQVSLAKMGWDILKYLWFFVVVLLGFAMGLARLYEYYDGMMQVDTYGIQVVQEHSFVGLWSTLKTLFWALLCMSPVESADVIIENLPGPTPNVTIVNEHVFTQAVGYVAFGCFEIFSVIIMLNMLIATMSNTFQRVTNNVDVEWTFARTEIFTEYFVQTTLPAPFNLLPTVAGFKDLWRILRAFPLSLLWLGLCLPAEARGKWCRRFKVMTDEGDNQRDFDALTVTLVRRYLREAEAVDGRE